MRLLEEILLGVMFYGGVALCLVAAFRVSETVGLAAVGVALMLAAVLSAGSRLNI